MKTEIEAAPASPEGAFIKEEPWVEEAPLAWPGGTIVVKDGDGALWQWQHNYQQQMGAGGTLETQREPDRWRQMPLPNMELSLDPAALLSGPASGSASASGSSSASTPAFASAPTPAFASAAASAPPPCYAYEAVAKRVSHSLNPSPIPCPTPQKHPKPQHRPRPRPSRGGIWRRIRAWRSS